MAGILPSPASPSQRIITVCCAIAAAWPIKRSLSGHCSNSFSIAEKLRRWALQVEDFESWLKTESQQQQDLKPHEEPSLLSAIVDARLELLRKPFNRLKAKKKPKPPPAPKAPANETADAKAEAAAEQQAAAEDTEPQHHEGARLFKCLCLYKPQYVEGASFLPHRDASLKEQRPLLAHLNGD